MLKCPLQNCGYYIKRAYFPLFRYYIGICICVSAYYFFSELFRCCEDLQYQRSVSSVRHSFTEILRHW